MISRHSDGTGLRMSEVKVRSVGQGFDEGSSANTSSCVAFCSPSGFSGPVRSGRGGVLEEGRKGGKGLDFFSLCFYSGKLEVRYEYGLCI